MYEGTKAYNPKVHGTLEEYLEVYGSGGAVPLFHGPEHYEMLWDLEALVPEFSVIRINGVIEEHEHYFVVDRERIEGITDTAYYRGVAGQHNVREFLTGRRAIYEVHSMDKGAIRRNTKS